MKKRVFLALMLMVAATATMAAYDFAVDGIYYNKLSDTTVEVTHKNMALNVYKGDIVLPETVSYNNVVYTLTKIGVDAFYRSRTLTSVTIPNTVTAIDDMAFQECRSLTKMEISEAVTSIGNSVFAGCIALEEITVDAGNPVYDSRGGCNAIIETATDHLIAGCMNTVIPNMITSIEKGAFRGQNVANVSIPDSVAVIGENAFYECTGLTNLELPNSVTTIGKSAFWGCTSMTSLVISNSVVSIGDYAFNKCSGITSMTLGSSVTTIGNYAFNECRGLNSIFIPPSVTSIGNYTFSYCGDVESIIVDADNPVFDSRDGCNAIIETATNQLYVGCKNTIIPLSVTVIRDVSFYGCFGLTHMDIPNTVTAIRSGAFYDCSGLTRIVMPNSVTYLGDFAFNKCSGLEYADIPESITYMGSFAFKGCTGLKRVICRILTPPSCSYAFDAYVNEVPPYETAILFVPAESLSAYRGNLEWGKFTHIVPFLGAGPGDVDGNGSINITDVTNLIDQLLSGGELPAWSDVNGDGNVSISDVTALIDMLLGSY